MTLKTIDFNYFAQGEHCKNAVILVGQQYLELKAFFSYETYLKCKFPSFIFSSSWEKFMG